MSLPDISVIGIGALGTTLTRALIAKGISVKSIYNRTPSKARKLAEELNIQEWGSFPETTEELGSLVFLTASDGAIRKIARTLSALKGNIENNIIVHCSGNESVDLLQPLVSQGATAASFHPLQTFTHHSESSDFEGIYFSLQGDDEAFSVLRMVARKLGAQTIEVTKEQKSHLHAAAVFASNYLTTLLNTSIKVGTRGGLADEEVKKALLPLVQTALKNASDQSFTEALSGPIKRGDTTTVKKHLKLLEDNPELQRLYSVLGIQTLDLAESSGALDGTVAQKMRKILQSGFNL